MSTTTEIVHIPRQEQWPTDDVIEYGPDVPLSARLEHERELMLRS